MLSLFFPFFLKGVVVIFTDLFKAIRYQNVHIWPSRFATGFVSPVHDTDPTEIRSTTLPTCTLVQIVTFFRTASPTMNHFGVYAHTSLHITRLFTGHLSGKSTYTKTYETKNDQIIQVNALLIFFLLYLNPKIARNKVNFLLG